jgi:hypothetical protein
MDYFSYSPLFSSFSLVEKSWKDMEEGEVVADMEEEDMEVEDMEEEDMAEDGGMAEGLMK